MKKVLGVYANPRVRWVGNGFPVQSLFSYQTMGQHISPFLLLDYAAPHEFAAGEERRGVGAHPHRGFETVTLVYQGELAHRDSTGAGGTIGAGDVQWMTAGAGIVHEEFHSEAFAASGGTLEMVQLWVNLPAHAKMTAPGYQTLRQGEIPVVKTDHGQVRIIAGQYEDIHGIARTHSELNVWDVALNAQSHWFLPVPDGHRAVVVVLQGEVEVDSRMVPAGHCVVMTQSRADVLIYTHEPAKFLLLSGVPFDEPVIGYGPFVMNTQEQIREAVLDYQNGLFANTTL